MAKDRCLSLNPHLDLASCLLSIMGYSQLADCIDLLFCLATQWDADRSFVQKMAPKRKTTRLNPDATPTPVTDTHTTTSVTNAQIQAMDARECTYPDFLKCQPLNFKGYGGVGNALTWWNSHVKTTTPKAAHAMPWRTLKKMMTDKYCPRGEIKKLEFEMWNLKVKGCIEFAMNSWTKDHTWAEHQVTTKEKLMTTAEQPESATKQETNTRVPQCQHWANRGLVLNVELKGISRRIAKMKKQQTGSRIVITPTALDHDYNVELADGRIVGFDVIIGMDWLAKYHAVIVCAEKIVRIPFGDEILIVRGDGSSNKHGTRLNIISCAKAQVFTEGISVFLANIHRNQRRRQVKEKRLEDVPVVQEFPEVFPEDLPGIPPTRQVEFRIDLVPGATPVARAPYRLAPSEMKELAEQLQELTDKGFIRPSSSLGSSMEHEETLGDLEIALRWKELYAKFSKCKVWSLTGYDSLGHVLTVGPCGYYRRFIEGFQRSPRNAKLNPEGVKFDWGDKQRSSFSLLNRSCAVHPIWPYMREAEDFIGILDASKKGLGLCEAKRKGDFFCITPVKSHEKNFTTNDLELGPVVLALKIGGILYVGTKKEREPLRVRALVMTIGLDLPKQILRAQTEARKPENIKKEDVGVLYASLPWFSAFLIITDGIYGAMVLNPLFLHLYLKEVVMKHGIHVSIIYDRDPRFASNFWKSLQKALCTSLDMSTAYHPQTDGQSERTIQTLKDMLRACVIDFGNSWVKHLPLVEFSYNNSYHASIKAAPFEALYGRKCRSPVCWAEVGQVQLTGPELRKLMEFQVGDKVMLKVSPWKGVICFGKRVKLNPRYVRPFKVLKKVRAVAYKLELPQELSKVHNTFHVSNLKKCYSDDPLVVPLEGLQVDDKLHFVEEPVEIMDREVKQLRRSRVPIVKVRWNSRRGPEFTWEREDQFRKKYPHLFTKTASSSSAV
ncbi:putative reverse transcriptase domain-containing protein [Tanacetum coccineum]